MFLVLSHNHPDHTGGAERLTKKYDVKELWSSDRLAITGGIRSDQTALADQGGHDRGEGVYDLYSPPVSRILHGPRE